MRVMSFSARFVPSDTIRVAQDIWRAEKRIESSGLRVGKLALITDSRASVTPASKILFYSSVSVEIQNIVWHQHKKQY